MNCVAAERAALVLGLTGPQIKAASSRSHDAAIVHIRVLTIDEALAILVASGIDEDEIPTEEFTGY